MKRSRIFLGATSALLAIAGAAAAKMSNFGTSTANRYYCTRIAIVVTVTICVTLIGKTTRHFTITGTNTYFFTVASSIYTVYTDGGGAASQTCTAKCQQPLIYSDASSAN